MRLAEVLSVFEARFPPAWAEKWDRVGLVCGDPDAQVRRVLLAVDPVEAVVEEALEIGADLVLVHHPLLLTPVSSIAASTPKGRIVHRLLTNGVALYTAHTNADVPAFGVNESIAAALGVLDSHVVLATDERGLDKLVVFAPVDAAEAVRAALADAGAGAIGAYDSCTFTTHGEGRFRPLEGSVPTIGEVGRVEALEEVRIETVYPRSLRRAVVAAMLAAHPYEEAAYDVIELGDLPYSPATGIGTVATRGHGRIGTLAEPMTLRAFAEEVAAVLPDCAHGVRVAGDPDRLVQRVAVGAGSGESLMEDVRRLGADVYVTSDLKHHRASEFLEAGGPALIDVAHWAAEWLWLPVVAEVLAGDLAAAQAGARDSVVLHVSKRVTDPWTFRP